jgi:NAD(P)-dependent dehydrogenase (short-subunit alcohol dehydrogenase family)
LNSALPTTFNQKEIMSFDGKTLIVTGGARGIGAEVARQFVRAGGRVGIGDLNIELGRALARELGDDKALFIPVDVTREGDCQAFVEQVIARFGPLDALVNSAIAINAGSLLEVSVDDWKKTLDIGLTGTFTMARTFVRAMKPTLRPGAIVNLSSVAAFNPYSGTGSYSTTKASVIHLSELMAIEWAPLGIRVNAVAPGTVETPLTAYLRDPAVRQARIDTIPLKRVGQPEDVAGAVLYLLSDAASWVTASTLVIDGGVNASLMNHIPGRAWNH